MARVYFSRGCKGMIVRRIQTQLQHQGFADGDPLTFVDGDFGLRTEAAVGALQQARGLPGSGGVDGATWQELCAAPLPSLFERCLQLTAAFEGYGFGLAKGNLNGAGISWGVLGFTLMHRDVQAVLAAAEKQSPGLLARAMGPLAAQWQAIAVQSLGHKIAWANALSSGPDKEKLPEPWLQAFARLGQEPAVKQAQLQRAYEHFFLPAASAAATLRLHSELGVLLAFDVQVQNGGFRDSAFLLAEGLPRALPEIQRREKLAEWLADSAGLAQHLDVMSRTTTIAQGQGMVHGKSYLLARWGFSEELAT